MKKENRKKEDINIETKQAFLSSAISDISSYIKLTDTKVSIIMAVIAAIIAAIATCYKDILDNMSSIKWCSLIGVIEILFLLAFIVGLAGVFLFGILTIRGHKPKLNYKSKWFIIDSVETYPFENYKIDVMQMTDADILDNMAAELYKLNDINRQKLNSYKWLIRCLSVSIFSIGMLLLLTL